MKDQPDGFRDRLLETSGEGIIGFYDREFSPFSNFSAYTVVWRGRAWYTSEHAYQAARFFQSAPEIAAEIAGAASADTAKKIAREHTDMFPDDWDEIKVGVMEEICRCKLQQHAYIRHKLEQSGDMLIVEDSPTDDFWGWGKDRTGRNELGKIWMRLRVELGSLAIQQEIHV